MKAYPPDYPMELILNPTRRKQMERDEQERAIAEGRLTNSDAQRINSPISPDWDIVLIEDTPEKFPSLITPLPDDWPSTPVPADIFEHPLGPPRPRRPR